MSGPVAGRRVAITAGASGIGRAIAERFLAGGARVHVCDISEDHLAEVSAAHPGLGVHRADVAVPGEVEAWVRSASGAMGGIDVLVNNAGIGGPRAALEDVSDADWERCIAVNLSGMFYAIKQVVPAMKARKAGCIVNISSTSARTGLPNRLPYAVSKVAVLGLTDTVARELGAHNIRCNAILPGAIDNPRGRGILQAAADERGASFAETEAEFLRYVSMRTWIDPAEIGDAAVFLASDAGRHISGQHLGVCGNVEWES